MGCGGGENEKIAFNYGRELFVYPYRGIKKSSEAKLLDKRVYKETRQKHFLYFVFGLRFYIPTLVEKYKCTSMPCKLVFWRFH